jgi:hypothetical protein
VTDGVPVIVVEVVQKAFGPTIALQGVDLVVESGTDRRVLTYSGGMRHRVGDSG